MIHSIKTIILFFLIFFCVAAQAKNNIITTIAGTGVAGYSGDNGPATGAKLNWPARGCFDKNGNIYFTDAHNNVVRKINAATGIITTVGGTGVQGFFGDGGPATNAQLSSPFGITIDTADNIYVGDRGNSRVRKINMSTGIITTIVGTGAATYGGDGGHAVNAYIDFPEGLCFDRLGNLYIADYLNHRVRKVDTAGIITTYAGCGLGAYSGDNGPATAAHMLPSDVCVDSLNNIYISDVFSAVRRVDAVTGIITTVAGTGVWGYSGDNGPATNAQLNQPWGICIDKWHNIFIADFSNYVVRKIDTVGIITTVAGNGTPGYLGDHGPATNAQLLCYDVFLDTAGSMYLAGGDSNIIRKVTYCANTLTATFTDTGAATKGYTYTGTNILTDSVRWNFGDGGTSTALNPIHTYTANGTYHTCVTVYSYCGSDSACKDIVITHVGAPLAPPRGELVIAPNPVKHELTVENAAHCMFCIYDMVSGSARLIKTIKNDKENIQLGYLPPGMYVVQVTDPDTGQRTIKKIIKQ